MAAGHCDVYHLGQSRQPHYYGHDAHHHAQDYSKQAIPHDLWFGHRLGCQLWGSVDGYRRPHGAGFVESGSRYANQLFAVATRPMPHCMGPANLLGGTDVARADADRVDCDALSWR